MQFLWTMRAFKLKVHFSRAGNFSGNNFHKIEIISRAWKFGLEFHKGCTGETAKFSLNAFAQSKNAIQAKLFQFVAILLNIIF